MEEPFELVPALQPGKRCCHCKQWKFLAEFNRRSTAPDGRQAQCRDCNKAYHHANWDHHMAQIRRRKKKTRAENQGRILEYLLTHPCVDCGESDPVVLQFDHLRDKRMHLARMIRNCTWTEITEEIEKCEVRCANCHTRRTMREARSWRTHGIRRDEGTLDV